MADRLTPAARSALMARIRGRDTGPEMAVRRMLHRAGYRFRVQVRRLPGTPDLVFPGRRKVIFVHGCFWHGHPGCPFACIPSTRREFWCEKIGRNRERDGRAMESLRAEGWSVLVVWECGIGSRTLKARLMRFLGPPATQGRRRQDAASRQAL